MKGYYNVGKDVKVQNEKNRIYDYTNETVEVASEIDFKNDIKEDINKSKIAVIAVLGTIAIVLVVSVVIVITSSMSSAKDGNDKVTVNSDNRGQKNEQGNEIDSNNEEIPIVEEHAEQSDVEIEEVDNSSVSQSNQEVSKTVDVVRDKVKALASTDNRVATIYSNFDKYPLNLMKDIVRNQEMIDYAVGYLDGIQKTYDANIDISTNVNDTRYKIPLFIQWDSRWGYYKYGNTTIGISGCGPTALCMVYLALTGDQTYNPLRMAQFSTDNGYCVPGVGTSWDLMIKGANQLGLRSQRLTNNEIQMQQSLEQGKLIIASMGPGTFTDKGHFIVFSGYSNGKFRINDPFCIAHSSREWSYSEFGNQIKALWVLSR